MDGWAADDAGARRDWLRLARARGVGARTFLRLRARFASPAAALEALPALAAAAGREGWAAPPDASIETELAAAERAGAAMLRLGAPGYPEALAAIADPPPLLWAVGDARLAANPCVAIAGARNASAAGLRLAAQLAEGLGVAGWTVVSGLARGIDGAAHAAALPTGTVAVLAGGVDVPYPPEHRALAAAVAAEGLLLSEATMGEAPLARSFPRRNRIVAGLCAGVVLVEAAERSGSLITARLALEQGREAMAVPGSPLDPRAAGCNALIREGAALIRSAADVIEALGAPEAARAPRLPLPPAAPRALPNAWPNGGPPPAAAPASAAEDADRVAALLGPTPVSCDALARAAGLSAEALAAALLDLDLDGRIARLPGDMVALVP